MRLLFWILGAAAGLAGGAIALERRSKRRVADSFLSALRSGQLVFEAYQPSIVGKGHRAELFRGTAAGRPFAFIAQTDVRAAKWSYALAWGDDRLTASWNPASGEADHPFSQAYVILRRKAAKDGGDAN